MRIHRAWVAACLLAGAVATPAFARVDVAVVIGVPPPVPMLEVAPLARPGYVWVPGYWAWHRDRHIWIRGQWIIERPGYIWVPDRWAQSGPHWHLHRGYWDRPRHGRGHAYGHAHRDRDDRRDPRRRRD